MDVDVGPFGGKGGSVWDDGRYVGRSVKEIIVKYDQCIHSITVAYSHKDTLVSRVHHGKGHDGSRTRKISLDSPEEYLIGVAGFAADFNGNYVIHSLTFITNKRKFKPIGKERGDLFNCAVGDYGGKLHISSFLGRSGSYLDAIGFHLSPLAEPKANPHEPMYVGPFGGHNGKAWDDGRDVGGSLKEIIVEHDQYIHNITVVYNHIDNSVSRVKHGHGADGLMTEHIWLDSPDEYLIGVAGFAADVNGVYVIRSLTFTTNKTKYGPIGGERGDFFNCAVGDHGDRLYISSFSGRSDSYLHAIGFNLSPLAEAQANARETMDLDVGPFGGKGGSEWDDGRHVGCGVKEIIVEHEYCINSINVVYNHNGTSVAVRHGQGHGGSRTKISLNFPEEYLICVAVFADSFNGLYVIRSLMFTTNKRRYAPIGVEDGNFFYYAAGEHGDRLHISSFKGRSGWYLNAIGVNLSRVDEAHAHFHARVTRGVPIVNFSGISRTCMEAIGFRQPSDYDTRLPKKKMVKGPWGGKDGNSWDDGTYAAVKKIRVAYDENGITSIYVEYDDNGCHVSCLHGGIGGRDRITITLNYPEEFLTRISGFTGLVGGLEVLQSLTFESNQLTYEAIGYENGTPFSYETDRSGNDFPFERDEYGNYFRITGFFGRSGGLYIDAIGVHISSPTQNLGGEICKTIWEMVRNFGRTACTSPSQADGNNTEAQTEMVPV